MLAGFCLCTCGTAEDTPPPGDAQDRVSERERIFNGAYENLDAAVLERLLAADYVVDYRGREASRSREQFVGELGQLRLVFPGLHIEIDSSRFTVYREQYIVQGIRTFHWRANDTPGSYRERFTNRWTFRDGQWLLANTILQPLDQ